METFHSLVGAIIGWLVLVVESMFAAPLWMVAHLAPDQDGVVGKMGQGYMLILSYSSVLFLWL
jgi:conjugal transfer/type IV secretion protein DotA/TraY